MRGYCNGNVGTVEAVETRVCRNVTYGSLVLFCIHTLKKIGSVGRSVISNSSRIGEHCIQ